MVNYRGYGGNCVSGGCHIIDLPRLESLESCRMRPPRCIFRDSAGQLSTIRATLEAQPWKLEVGRLMPEHFVCGECAVFQLSALSSTSVTSGMPHRLGRRLLSYLIMCLFVGDPYHSS
ncbi:hypothetical protein BDV18DRAFT_139518 [Aspergillus unguis]